MVRVGVLKRKGRREGTQNVIILKLTQFSIVISRNLFISCVMVFFRRFLYLFISIICAMVIEKNGGFIKMGVINVSSYFITNTL